MINKIIALRVVLALWIGVLLQDIFFGIKLKDSAFGEDLFFILLTCACVFTPFIMYRPPTRKSSRVFDLIDIPAHCRSQLDNFKFKDEDFERACYFVFNMTPDEFIRFCRVMVEIRYDAEQQGMTSVSEYLRKHRKPL